MARELRKRWRAILIITFRGHDFKIEIEDDFSKVWVFRPQCVGMENIPGRLVIGAVAEEGFRVGRRCDQI
jgi:hypothetical protein